MPADNLSPVLMNIQQVCDRILSTQAIAYQEHMQLVTYFLNDALVNEAERRAINQVLDELQLGRIRFSA